MNATSVTPHRGDLKVVSARVTEAERRLIDTAAAITGERRATFIVRAAVLLASQILDENGHVRER